MAATISIKIKTSKNWDKNSFKGLSFFFSLSLLGPYCFNRFLASPVLNPSFWVEYCFSISSINIIPG